MTGDQTEGFSETTPEINIARLNEGEFIDGTSY